jgi:hypothetical protein
MTKDERMYDLMLLQNTMTLISFHILSLTTAAASEIKKTTPLSFAMLCYFEFASSLIVISAKISTATSTKTQLTVLPLQAPLHHPATVLFIFHFLVLLRTSNKRKSG